MIIKKLANGGMKVHVEDADDYEVTDDNGVDIRLTKKQVERFIQIIEGGA